MSARTPDRGAVTVRRATSSDLTSVARVHVETWKATYRGIVSDDWLDALKVESDIARGFGQWLARPIPGWAQFAAIDSLEGVVGFAAGGPESDHDPEFTGELGAIYVLKSFQGRGFGRKLTAEIARHLLGTGHHSMLVWILEANPYRRFYEKLGGVPVRTKMARVAGALLPEVAYGWIDIRGLTGE